MLKILINPPTIISGTAESPDFSGIPTPAIPLLQAAIDAGEYEIIPDPEPPTPEPEPNFDGFIDAIAYGIGEKKYPLVQAWYNALPPVTRDPLQDAIGKQDLQAIGDRLQKTMLVSPPDDLTSAQIVEILIDFDIPIPFP